MNKDFLVTEIVTLLKSILNKGERTIPLHEPLFAGKEWDYVKNCLDTGWVSSVGQYVDEFEDRITQYTGASHAVCTVNGTAALHICLKLAGVGPNDEVILPAFTFVATANAVSYCGAVPHFIDNDCETLGPDPEKLEDYLRETAEVKDGICYSRKSGYPIRAAVIMHTFGHPADIDPLIDICMKYRIVMIEDAAESLGSFYKGRHTGTFGKVSALSFNGNKIVTTGGGGAILTNDRELARMAKHITTTAKQAHPWAFLHDQVAYNYRMPNINAALGCAQMESLDEFLRLKRSLADRYREAFRPVKGITFFQEAEYARSNYWLNTLILAEEHTELRDVVLAEAIKEGISTRPPWTMMNHLEMYKGCPQMDLSSAESLVRRLINIPSSAKEALSN